MKSVLNYFLIDIYFCTNYSMNEIDKTSDQTRSHFILSHILNLLFPNWHAVSVPIAIFSCNFISCTRIYLSGTIALYYLYFSFPLMSNCRFLSYFNFRFIFHASSMIAMLSQIMQNCSYLCFFRIIKYYRSPCVESCVCLYQSQNVVRTKMWHARCKHVTYILIAFLHLLWSFT